MYIDLGGSHAHKGEGTVPNDLVTSLMETRHPLDAKMKQSQVALFKVMSPTTLMYMYMYYALYNSEILLKNILMFMLN